MAATTSSSCPTAWSGRTAIPIPALLATAGVHHHLIRKGLRTSVGLVVETGEAREVHHFCVLAGYGAEAINPYLAFETLTDMKKDFPEEVDDEEIVHRYVKSIDKGILKVMSKMGISTYQSYCGAQIFDAIGLASEFVDRYFFGTATTIEGVGLAEIAEETVRRHAEAFGDVAVLRDSARYRRRIQLPHARRAPCLDAGLGREPAACGPRRLAGSATRTIAREMNEQSKALLTIRGLFDIKLAEDIGASPVPLDEVEPAAEIVKRFVTGAMSLRLDLARGAHDARHRHEPDRRQVEHRRGRRGSRALRADGRMATPCARRSSRSPRAASA